MGTTLERRPEAKFERFFDWLDMPDFFRAFDRGRLPEMIKVEEKVTKGHVVIKAEMPGIDPDKGVEITVTDGLLTIAAERREEERKEEDGRTTSEFRYGSFRRTLHVPKDVKAADIKAAYKDGILTITVPVPKAVKPEVLKVPVSHN